MSRATPLAFAARPSLGPAYLRVLFGRRAGLRRPTDLPSLEATWSGAQIAPPALRGYRELCAIRDEPGLPVHFPHVLASPLHLRLLTQPEFPLGLLGAVHARNHVIRYRVIDPSETLDLHVGGLRARFRPQGVEIDFDTVVESSGQRVWAERTTFLCRKKGLEEDPASPLAAVFPWEGPDEDGEQLHRFRVPRRAGWSYAGITGDYNPIHISRLLAKLLGFRRDLVHGMWGLARATAPLEELQTEGPVRIDAAFKGPLYMEHEVTVSAKSCPGGRSLRLRCEGDERPAIQVAVRRVAEDAELAEPP